MASAASSPPPVQLLPTLDHRLPAKLRRGRKVWPGVFSFSAAGGSLKGCHELLLPSLLAAASASSGESGGRLGRILCLAPRLCEPETLALDWSSVTIGEARSDEELLASVRLRVRSFYEFNQSYNIEGHKEYVVDREFEALKERVAGKKTGFRRASCINATLPLSKLSSHADDLCTACKFYDNEEQRVVIATLDLNQCLSLADELTGKKPEGTGNDLPRAYLSNVCVAHELHRNGLGNALVLRSRKVAEEWGITDLYVHVAVDNEAAKKLYEKTGFTYESEEPAWQARFLGRPRRFLLWSDLTRASD